MQLSLRQSFRALVVFVVVGIGRVDAQSAQHSIYASVSAGVAVEPDLFSVRSAWGGSAAVAVGRVLSSYTAIQGRAGAEYFAAPPQVIGPGGCLGRQPCNPPQPGAVTIATLAAEAVISGAPEILGPLLIIGGGLRHVSESPEQTSEIRPFLDLGAGLAFPIGSGSLGLEARYQLAAAHAGLPQWTLPIQVTVRFF